MSEFDEQLESDDEVACAGFKVESDACDYLDGLLGQLESEFEIIREAILEPNVTRVGWSVGNHTVKNTRVDRLLIPKVTPTMLTRWNLGVTAIEVKKSGQSLTSAAQQMRDNIGARYFNKSLGLVYTVSCGFVFPFKNPRGAALGQMNQERVGVITPNRFSHGSACVKLGSDICIAFQQSGPPIINLCRMQYRSGHR